MSCHSNNSKSIICDSLFLLDTNNTLQNVLDLINSGSGGGGGSSGITTLTGSGAAVVTGTSTSKNITVDLSMFSTTSQINALFNNYSTTTAVNNLLANKISTTHESNKIGINNVDFGAYNSTMKTLTLENASGVTAVLSVDLGGNLNKGADGVITVPILNAWSFLTVKTDDGAGNIRNITSCLTGDLLFNNIQLATQAWVTANFLSPLNPRTVGVGPGLSANMTANSLTISVDRNLDRRNLFILQDANNVLRNITTNTSGNLLYDNAYLATEHILQMR